MSLLIGLSFIEKIIFKEGYVFKNCKITIVPIVQCPGLICLWSGAQHPWSGWHWTLDNACDTLSRLDFCPAICPLTIFSLSVSDWDTGYFAPNLDCCVTRCELLMTRCRWLVYCVAVWPPHQCSDLVWWNSPEILINGRPSSTALHSSQRLIEKFAGDYQDTEPDWVRTGLIISLVSMSYCHNLVFLVFKPNFFWW